MSNVQAGDLAVIINDDALSPSKLAGLLVDVLYAAPSGEYNLPDGQPALSGPNAWVIKFQKPITVRLERGTRTAVYAGCPDAMLRPIRPHGDEEQDESRAWLPPIPTHHKEPA